MKRKIEKMRPKKWKKNLKICNQRTTSDGSSDDE